MLSITDKHNMEQLFIIHRNLNKLHDRLGRFNYADKRGMKHNSVFLQSNIWLNRHTTCISYTWHKGKRERIEPILLKLIEGYQQLYLQVSNRLNMYKQEIDSHSLDITLEGQGRCIRSLEYIQEQIKDIKEMIDDNPKVGNLGMCGLYLFTEGYGYKDYLANIIDVALGFNKYVLQAYRRQHRYLYRFYHISTHI